MELTALWNNIIEKFSGSKEELESILADTEQLSQGVFPFNKYEYLMMRMMDSGGLTFQQYVNIRENYFRKNKFLWVYEISSPRGFGERFAEGHLKSICPTLEKASKKRDSNYTNQYDLWLDGITIEVKASRAVDGKSKESIYKRALSRNTERPFLMNFQQLKPQYCHVFIWLAVFRDQLVIWVMNSAEVRNNPLYSIGQHRGNKGNEGQLHINERNIHEFDKYELLEHEKLKEYIIEAYHRLDTGRQ